MTPAFDLVMLDLDGTLIDTAPEIAAAVNAALTESGHRTVEEAEVRGWIGDGARELMRRAWLRATGVSEAAGRDASFLCAALRSFEWHYAAVSGSFARPYPGAIEGLDALRDLGVALALVTNKESRFTAPLLHAHGLWKYLDPVVCGDMLAQKKPHPLPVEHCLARAKTPHCRALLVGDSEIDVATARNAGVSVWAVPYGYCRGGDIGQARPDRVVPTILAVAEAIVQNHA